MYLFDPLSCIVAVGHFIGDPNIYLKVTKFSGIQNLTILAFSFFSLILVQLLNAWLIVI